MITLRPTNLRWVQGVADDPKDLCAHGDVEFAIASDVVLDAVTGKDLTVSAAALYLLRTLSVPHTRDRPVGDHLFPCCGFTMWEVADSPEVIICECPNGVDFEVTHQPDGTGVMVRALNGREWPVSWSEWRTAVFAFADTVSEFYAACSPKEPPPEDEPGLRAFAAEWKRRRGEPLELTIRRGETD